MSTAHPPQARTPDPPRLPPALEPLALDALGHHDAHAEVAVAGPALPGVHANAVVLSGATITEADLSGGRMDELRLTDVRVVRGNLANLHAPRASLTRVAFAGTRLTGMTLTEARLADVSFEDCLLARSDLLGARLDAVRFHGCDLTGADIREARMRGCELRGCTLEDLEGVAGLRGAALEWPDVVAHAGTWAAALGIGILRP